MAREANSTTFFTGACWHFICAFACRERFHGGIGPHRQPGPAILHIRTVPRHHCPWTAWFSNDGPLARDINGVEKYRKACNYDPLEVLASVPVSTRSKFSPFRWLACKYGKRCHKLTFGEPQVSNGASVESKDTQGSLFECSQGRQGLPARTWGVLWDLRCPPMSGTSGTRVPKASRVAHK